jgi:hypothetical protein
MVVNGVLIVAELGTSASGCGWSEHSNVDISNSSFCYLTHSHQVSRFSGRLQWLR